MIKRARVQRWRHLYLCYAVAVGTVPAFALGVVFPAMAGAATATTAISTSQFVNQFDAEPYVGNGYFSQRIPATGMGLLTGLGTIGWPLGTPRDTEALAAGVTPGRTLRLAFIPTRPST